MIVILQERYNHNESNRNEYTASIPIHSRRLSSSFDATMNNTNSYENQYFNQILGLLCFKVLTSIRTKVFKNLVLDYPICD